MGYSNRPALIAGAIPIGGTYMNLSRRRFDGSSYDMSSHHHHLLLLSSGYAFAVAAIDRMP